MDILLLIGRIIFGGFFLMMGVMHFKNVKGLTEYARAKGVMSPKSAVIVTGLILLLGGIGVILGLYVKVALILIAVFLFFSSMMMHTFWKETDAQMKMGEMQHFLKNVALLGATLALLALSSGWALSVL